MTESGLKRWWQAQHPKWLRACCHRSCLSLNPIGRVNGKYYPYAMHHACYPDNYLWFNVLPLTKEEHEGFIHNFLSNGQKPSQQKHYPNLPQRLVHLHCRIILLSLICFHLFYSLLAPIRYVYQKALKATK